jgi:hypothetical protein
MAGSAAAGNTPGRRPRLLMTLKNDASLEDDAIEPLLAPAKKEYMTDP